jgi:putative transposase
MARITPEAKKAKEIFQALKGEEWLMEELAAVRAAGKAALDECTLKMGRVLAETILCAEREQMAGGDYQPSGAYRKWGWQAGSVYLGEGKTRMLHPRLRDNSGEVILPSYSRMRQPGGFPEELLIKSLRGISARKYRETVTPALEYFGVSPTSVSKQLIQATGKKLKELKDRDLSSINLFALLLDTVHRGDAAFVVALGIDTDGKKHVLGFWEGATENKEVATCLLSDLESRGLGVPRETIFITDGGKGIISALKDKFGRNLIHQRCTIHKDRNIQRHLPKRYRKDAHRRYCNALAMADYADAKHELDSLEEWLAEINESAVQSLREAKEELLTLHRLEVPSLLRTVLHSTNPIESMFSTVRHCEKNIKRYRNSKMAQRWLAAVALYAEENFRTIKGYEQIPGVIKNIKRLQNRRQVLKQAA